MARCQGCNGTGWVTYSTMGWADNMDIDEHEETCDECDGTGAIPDDADADEALDDQAGGYQWQSAPDDRVRPEHLSLFPDRDSARDDDAGRHTLDAYWTPENLAGQLVELLALAPGTVALEGHAGGGAFVRAANAAGCKTYAIDIQQTVGLTQATEGFSMGTDFLQTRAMGEDKLFVNALQVFPRPQWVIGNPPYADAEAHVRKALEIATDGVAMLLRLGFLAGRGRADGFWKDWPLTELYVLSQRPSFTGRGTDSYDYGWFIWRKPNRSTLQVALDAVASGEDDGTFRLILEQALGLRDGDPGFVSHLLSWR